MPLADKLRPETIDEIIGQEHILGPNGVIRKMITSNVIQSMILWGPAGIGKTTLARSISNDTSCDFIQIHASGAKIDDIRKAIATATKRKKQSVNTIILIDEIHRLTRVFQDSLLSSVETGEIILIGATTERPVYSIISSLLSRMLVFELHPLSKKDMIKVILKVMKHYQDKKITIDKDAVKLLLNLCSGDARKLISSLETIIEVLLGDESVILSSHVEVAIPNKFMHFDKSGNEHYDNAQCWQTAIQNSDADSAIYWLAKWMQAEDPAFLSRRILVSAAEDSPDNSDAQVAAMLACMTIERCGLPEGRIAMALATIKIAKANRTRFAINAIDRATSDVMTGEHINTSSIHEAGHNTPDGYIKINRKYIDD